LFFPFATLGVMSWTVLPPATDVPSDTDVLDRKTKANTSKRVWVANTTAVVVRRRLTELSNWEAMKTACASSGTVTLSNSFIMGNDDYTSEIDFSGKQLVIIGNSKTLNAGKNG
jgi:hypothetical protein